MGISLLGGLLASGFLAASAHAYVPIWGMEYTLATGAYEKGDYTAAEQHDRAALAAAGSFEANDPRLRATLTQLGAVLQARGECCEAEIYLKRVVTLNEAQFGKTSKEAALAQNNLAAVLRQEGRLEESRSLQAAAFATAEKVLDGNSPDLIPHLTLAAIFEKDASRYAQAESLLKRAQTILNTVSAPEPRQIMQIWKYLGGVYRVAGRFDEAEDAYRKLAALAEAKLGADTIDNATALANLGEVLCERKFYAESRPHLVRAVDIYQRIHEDHSPLFATVLQTLASAELYLGQAHSAEQRMLLAIYLLNKQHPFDQEALAVAHNNLGQVYALQGEYKDAEAEIMRAKDIWVARDGAESAKVATVLSNLGGLYVQQRKYKKGEAVYKESALIDGKLLGEASVAFARDLNRLGVLYNCQKRYSQSEEILRKALAIDTEKLGVNSPILAEPYLNLGSSLQGQRRLGEALESFRRGIEIMTNAGQRHAHSMAPVLSQYSSLLREMKLWADAEQASTEALAIRVKEKVHGESYN